MGIYLVIFMHRDAKHLIWGVSFFFRSLPNRGAEAVVIKAGPSPQSLQAHHFPDAKGTNCGDTSLNALPTHALTEPLTPAVTPDQHLHQPLLTSRMPSSLLASGTTITLSSAVSSDSGGSGGGRLRGQPHPRWWRIPFLLRDAEAARDAAEAATLATATADADAEPATRMTATATTPPSLLPGGELDRASAGVIVAPLQGRCRVSQL